MQNILSKGKGEKLSKKKSKTKQTNIDSAMAAKSQKFKHQLSIFLNSLSQSFRSKTNTLRDKTMENKLMYISNYDIQRIQINA